MKNEDGTFTKTARFIAKYGHYGTPGVAAQNRLGTDYADYADVL